MKNEAIEADIVLKTNKNNPCIKALRLRIRISIELAFCCR